MTGVGRTNSDKPIKEKTDTSTGFSNFTGIYLVFACKMRIISMRIEIYRSQYEGKNIAK